MADPDPNEQIHLERLEALDAYNIMDTEPEPEFDDIVLVASTLCGTPVALVSLVEKDRQWFKARIGFEACETPIGQSVCAHALGSSDVLVIPDLQLDQRTRTNTLVTGEPHIRFYAGAPLITPDEVIIGTLCVIDVEPRPQGLEEGQKAALQALARQVIALLEMRRISQRKDDLFRRQKSISANIRSSVNASLAAQEAGRVGTFEIDIGTSMMRVSREFCRIFHLPIADTYPTRVVEEMVLPQDKDLQSNDATRRKGSAPLDVEYRIRVPGYGVRWIARNASFRHDERGRPINMIGTVRDVTAAKREAARVQALLDLGDRLRDLSDMESMAIAAGDLMARALDATRAGFGIVNAADETVSVPPEWCAPGVKSLAGLHHFRDYGSFVDDLKRGETVVVADVATDPRTRDHAERLLSLGIRVLVNVPIFELGRFKLVAFIHHDQPYPWIDEEISFVRSFGNRIQIAMSRVQAELEQQMLSREMSHRLKNTLSMVQAIATQTLRPVTERDHVEAFEKRLHALSTAHDILFEQNWTSASVYAVVDRTMNGIGMRDRIDAQGPNVRFGPKGSLSLSLLLHELTTNAVKYGALSNDTGRVAIDWRIEGTGDGAIFYLSWRETGGPPPRQPERKGFGSKLIRMGLIGTGGVLVSYDHPGFSAEMTAVLLQLAQAD
ncbi:GAF domain-containing protein [Neorhizobium galegae]|uniref:Blue-light-activated histidine kinase n=1 Tax=Neorhizobium galegae TaxID=399 RepID=A0A6A1TU07_NEOGA|nr:GAF domain-containing protein [Neorhizobium galegae]KAB1087515.1 GAF domain-containing protein [Neorhizobium galegae]